MMMGQSGGHIVLLMQERLDGCDLKWQESLSRQQSKHVEMVVHCFVVGDDCLHFALVLKVGTMVVGRCFAGCLSERMASKEDIILYNNIY